MSGAAWGDCTRTANMPTDGQTIPCTAASDIIKRLFQFGLYIAFESVQVKLQALRHGHALPRPEAKLVLLQLGPPLGRSSGAGRYFGNTAHFRPCAAGCGERAQLPRSRVVGG